MNIKIIETRKVLINKIGFQQVFNKVCKVLEQIDINKDYIVNKKVFLYNRFLISY